MYQNYGWKYVVIALVAAACLSAYSCSGITLGLDLQGGTELRYSLDLSQVPPEHRTTDLTEQAIEILKRRLDIFGLKEITPRRAGAFEILIQLPGADEAEREQLKRVIERGGVLEFKIVAKDSESRDAQKEVRRILDLKKQGLYDPSKEVYDAAPFRDKVRPPQLLLNKESVSGGLLNRAYRTTDEYMGLAVGFEWGAEGAKRFEDLTTAHKGEYLAIVLDGEIQSAPVIQSVIREHGQITGGSKGFDQDEVRALIVVLNAGSLPAKLLPEAENTVGPQLGKESIGSGLWASIGALLVVAVFMVGYYRVAGLISNVALALNLVIIVGVLAVFGGTLTLPGFAGLALTVGMAVDANILIFERIREEMEAGASLRQAVELGYGRAFWVIFDSNVTTILTALVLVWIGTGPIKGFGVTLSVGITASMFTALFVTKAIFAPLIAEGALTKLKFARFLAKPNLAFIDKRVACITGSLIIINAGWLLWLWRGEQKYGIDFTGGSVLEIQLAKASSKSEVEERLASITRTDEQNRPFHPYENVEVQRVFAKGEPRDSALGTRFQVRVREVKTAAKGAPAGGPGAMAVPGIEREAFAETGAGAAKPEKEGAGGAAAGGAGRPGEIHGSDLSRFVDDVKRVFEKDLAPESYRVKELPATPAGLVPVELTVHFWEATPGAVDASKIAQGLREAGLGEFQVREGETRPVAGFEGGAPPAFRGIVLLTEPLEPAQVKKTVDAVKAYFKGRYDVSSPIPYVNSIGSSVAYNLKTRAFLATLGSFFVMIGYMAIRFDLKGGIAATIALIHDVFVTMGALAVADLTSPWTGIDAKVNLPIIAAFLTIVGYSVNDTIVIFDRIREDLHLKPRPKEEIPRVIDEATNQTLSRTILTSGTTLLSVLILLLFGGKAIQGMSYALFVGIITGTYSSIYVASAILIAKPKNVYAVLGGEAAFLLATYLAKVAGFLGSA